MSSETQEPPGTCLIVTGASRGLGRAIAEAFCETLLIGTVILVARTKVEDRLEDHCQDVHWISADLSNLTLLDASIDKILEIVSRRSYKRILFVNNAGSLGHIGESADTPTLKSLQSAIDFNVTSCLWLSIRLAKFSQQQASTELLIVHISSLVAVQPFPTLGVYSAGKAARDSYHNVLGLEGVRTINYAPGPLETTMTQELRASENLDASLQPAYRKKLVHPKDSAKKLVGLIQSDNFESGQHIDYYDL